MAGTGLYSKLTTDAQQERALLSAIGFTGGFAACRGVTHAIRRGIPPFHNLSSKGGTHIHHSTFGIFGLLGIGFLWAQQVFTGHDEPPRWGSRITATTYGISSALTLDEFALWLDLHDDYWDAQGRKSVDAAILFGGLLSIASVASEGLEKAGWMPKVTRALAKLDIRHKLPSPLRTDEPVDSGAHPDSDSAAPAPA
jgi:hypothetical protein